MDMNLDNKRRVRTLFGEFGLVFVLVILVNAVILAGVIWLIVMVLRWLGVIA